MEGKVTISVEDFEWLRNERLLKDKELRNVMDVLKEAKSLLNKMFYEDVKDFNKEDNAMRLRVCIKALDEILEDYGKVI